MNAEVIAEAFRKMAARIELNANEPFGGCALIVPPGEPPFIVEMLKLDPTPDGAVFWGEIRAKADSAVAKLQEEAHRGRAFGMR